MAWERVRYRGEERGCQYGDVQYRLMLCSRVINKASLRSMKKGRMSGIDEVFTEMTIAAGEVGVIWTKRLLNVRMIEGSVPEDWRTGLIVSIMVGEGRCSRSGEVRGNYAAKSPHEYAEEDSEWEDKKECGDGDRRRAAGV